MKYVIDIPNDGQCQYKYNEDTKELKFPCPRIDPNSFMGLDIVLTGATPYTEPDEDEIRQKVENEVWDFAISCIDMDGIDFYRCFEHDSVFYLTEYTYSEAKSKYDEWKRKKDEIRVGDEIDIDGEITVVTMINKYGEILSVDCDGMTYYYHVESQLKRAKKTGRHFYEVGDLLRKIKEK